MATKTRRLYAPASLAPLLAFAMLFSTGTPASGQTAPVQDQQTMPPQTMPPEQTVPPQREGDNDTTRRELAEMDRFMDGHPEVAEQLRKDPSLINNQDFLEKHPALQEFLQNHPGVREEFQENPNAFMRQENRYERHEGDDRDRDRDRRDGDTTRKELASMDRFMDAHPEIAEQLRKNPLLINNREFVENHPALQEYLQSHPEVREEFKENPNAFMRQENRYDRHEDDRDRDRDNRIGMGGRGDLTGFGQFLGGHSTVAEQLSKDPSLANNKEYLANHPELAEYLKAHPTVTKQLSENPQAVMSSNWVLQGSGTAGKTTPPKGKPNPNQ